MLVLRDGVAALVSHPDIGAVEDHVPGSYACGERAKNLAVAGTELGHDGIEPISDPDIGTVKGHTSWAVADSNRAQVCTVTGTPGKGGGT